MSSTAIRTLREDGLRDFFESIYQFGLWRLAETKTVQGPITDRCIDEDHLSKTAERSINYGSTEQIRVSHPICTQNSDDFSELTGTYEVSRPSVYEINDAELLGPYALTLTENGEYIFANALDRTMGLSLTVLETAISKFPNRGYPEQQPIESAVSLVGPFVRTYFHWFVDYLPRLSGVEAYERATDEEPAVVYPKDPPSWLLDSLSLLVDEDRLIEWHEDRCRVGSLIVPSVRRSSSHQVFSTDALEWVRNKILEEVRPSSDGPNRIYISRDDAKERRVENETAVLDLLSEYGFQRFTLSELSFREQVRLFHGAEFIVAPHGSGLTNVLWAENSQVVELFGDLVPRMFFTMVSQLGHDYAAVFGEQVGPDIQIDATELRSTIECALHSRNLSH